MSYRKSFSNAKIEESSRIFRRKDADNHKSHNTGTGTNIFPLVTSSPYYTSLFTTIYHGQSSCCHLSLLSASRDIRFCHASRILCGICKSTLLKCSSSSPCLILYPLSVDSCIWCINFDGTILQLRGAGRQGDVYDRNLLALRQVPTSWEDRWPHLRECCWELGSGTRWNFQDNVETLVQRRQDTNGQD